VRTALPLVVTVALPVKVLPTAVVSTVAVLIEREPSAPLFESVELSVHITPTSTRRHTR
jgi:hypothetical protein